jgi:hypothetical protein
LGILNGGNERLLIHHRGDERLGILHREDDRLGYHRGLRIGWGVRGDRGRRTGAAHEEQDQAADAKEHNRTTNGKTNDHAGVRGLVLIVFVSPTTSGIFTFGGPGWLGW